jgi:acyl-CoA thioesterase
VCEIDRSSANSGHSNRAGSMPPIDPPSGGISVDLIMHVHRTIGDHDGSWLAGRFEIETIVDGLAVEHGRICTLDGELLAESFQTRWTAGA